MDDNNTVVREGNAKTASWDGVDAQIDALKRLARTRVDGHECAMPCSEFADIVERLDAARKRELASRDQTSFHCGDCSQYELADGYAGKETYKRIYTVEGGDHE